MKLKTIIHIPLLLFGFYSYAQPFTIPENIGTQHPRIFGKDMSVSKLQDMESNNAWAKEIISKTKERIDPYVSYYNKDNTWLKSRLQMYWSEKSTDVFINGGTYDHAEGHAPEPTIKFPGSRGGKTDYLTPKLEDIKPFMDDSRGLYLESRQHKGQWEWVAISKTSGIVEGINRKIMGLARDAAFLYWYTGERKYADMAYGVLDTYLKGLYYREVPQDINRGHNITIVGYTSFEVIQEHIINDVAQCYDFLYGYINKYHTDSLGLYTATLQKWADLIIKNGVSFNNWNLLEAAHISKIALVLENDKTYTNSKGAQYYLDQIMNQNSVRQWSMRKLIDYGYDPENAIWNESPGYSLNVLNDFMEFAAFYDRNFDIDLLKDIPVLTKAAKSTAQYLYPNKYMVAFGDGHYSKLRPEPVKYLIHNAQKYGKKQDEVYFTKMLKTLYDVDVQSREVKGTSLQDLFEYEGLTLQDSVKPGMVTDFTSPLFYSPRVSWLVQRQGDAKNGLMISQIGSFGNHMHSNGIAMELYGKGFPLAPEMGHGSSYFSTEYAEYYTQFPAHNTVSVNGKSKYPEMKSNHAFKVVAAYPESGKNSGTVPGYTFSDLMFLEPETNSAQRRVMGIIQTEGGGYYVDVFRSVQNEGNNTKHEYFFHNLGQKLELFGKNNTPLKLADTDALAFGNGDQSAYDYMWNKKSVFTVADFKGTFSLELKERTVNMNLWFQGQPDREVFSVLSPKSTAFRHGPLPEDLNNLPIPTLVVKQNGEAWKRPFVAIYEPAENGKSDIASVDYFGTDEQAGIHITAKSGREDFIFTNTQLTQFTNNDLSVTGTYGVISKDEKNTTLFLGNGTRISNGVYAITATQSGSLTVKQSAEGMFYQASVPAVLSIKAERKLKSATLTDTQGTVYKGRFDKKNNTILFDLPAMDYQQVNLKIQ
nr:heparinase II/III family protein [uncultured Flavobacterium sp.]